MMHTPSHAPERRPRRFALAWSALATGALLLGLTACGGPASVPEEPAKQASQGGGKVNIFIWSAYLPKEVLDEFKQRTGIDYNFDLYDSNEALLEKLQSGVADYDLVVPSDYMVRILIAEGLIQPLDHARLPNLANLDQRFLDKAFDPGNRYTFPYFWGTTGLGYNKQATGGPIDSWAAVFNERYKGRILMLDDMREAFAVALKSEGKSLNERNPMVLRRTAELLKRQKRLVKTYNSGDFANILASGDVDLAHGYNGQLAEVVAADPDRFAYVVPKEGGTFWMDNVAIPAKARNLDAAYAFLNFILEGEVMAKIVNATHYASANAKARQWIEPAILADPAIFPPDEVLDRCELIEDLGETTQLLDRLWTEIKAQ